MKLSHLLIAAAVTGLMASPVTQSAAFAADEAAPVAKEADKNTCKAKDGCKAKGGETCEKCEKKASAADKDKNACKSKDGCGAKK